MKFMNQLPKQLSGVALLSFAISAAFSTGLASESSAAQPHGRSRRQTQAIVARQQSASALVFRTQAGLSLWNSAMGGMATPALGLELGVRRANGFSGGAIVQLNKTPREGMGAGLVAINPEYSVTHEWGRLSGGLAVGALFRRNYYSYAYSINTFEGLYNEEGSGYRTIGRFALVPNASADFPISRDAHFHLSMHYITTFGEGANLGALVPMAGLGFQF